MNLQEAEDNKAIPCNCYKRMYNKQAKDRLTKLFSANRPKSAIIIEWDDKGTVQAIVTT